MAMTRFQDGVLVAIVLIDFKRLRWPALLLIPGVLIGFAPQLVVDQVQFGTWLPQRPFGQALDPLHGQYLDVLPFRAARGRSSGRPPRCSPLPGSSSYRTAG